MEDVQVGEAEDARLSIGVFARRTRLSMKALRLYDRIGLLTPASVDQDSGYRWYRESQLATARLVAMLRRLDMPLAQVAEVVSAPGPRGAELLAAYWQAVESRVVYQRELAAHLQIQLSGGEGSYGMYEIRERDVPAQLVLSEQRHLPVAELPGWIGAAMTRLWKSAAEHGGGTGPEFVVYYGLIDEDNDGPVECCVPIAPDKAASTDAATRRESAHREAYTRLTKAQVGYPQILSAYEAVEQWVSANGHTVAGPPREVYLTDFMAAAPTDEVCDVAFPIQ